MKVLVGQSGGPTVAINSSLAGVIKACIDRNIPIFGLKHGIEGLFNENFVNLSIFKDRLETLKRTPAMALGSCRYKLKDEEMPKVASLLEKNEFTHFIYIGGNDSMDTVAKLANYVDEYGLDIKVIGIPKTIDNDLVITDHTPGFGSAARFVYHSIQDIYFDAKIYDINTVVIVEIMGRDAGWLTLASTLPRVLGKHYPHLIYFPEVSFSVEKFLEDVKEQLKNHKVVVVAVSEGIKNESGDYIASQAAKNDQFAHQMLGGVGKYLENIVKHEIGSKCRSIELNVLQRANISLASATDLKESFEIAYEGTRLSLEEGMHGEVMCYERESNLPYNVKFTHTKANNIANQVKHVPSEFIGYDEDTFKRVGNYLLPLIKGHVDLKYLDDDIIDYIDLDEE